MGHRGGCRVIMSSHFRSSCLQKRCISQSLAVDSLEFVECSSAITPGIKPKVGKKLEIENTTVEESLYEMVRYCSVLHVMKRR